MTIKELAIEIAECLISLTLLPVIIMWMIGADIEAKVEQAIDDNEM